MHLQERQNNKPNLGPSKRHLNRRPSLENQIYSAVDIVPPQGHLHDFSQSGDSVPTVFDAKGDLYGLLFAGTDLHFSLMERVERMVWWSL